MNIINSLRDLTRDHWYRSELLRTAHSGAGAVSLYFSLHCGSLFLILVFAFTEEMQTASVAVFFAMVFLSWSFMICDVYSYHRMHGLPLLRRAAWRCEGRMKRLGVESSSIFAFLDWLYGDPDLERMFRSRPNESIQAAVKTLDRLSATAILYGPSGKHVFMQNLNSCRALDFLLGPGAVKGMSQALGPELRQRLEQVPCYDPEGWSLTLSAH